MRDREGSSSRAGDANSGQQTRAKVVNQQVIPHVTIGSLRIADITDGTTNTFLIGERRFQIDPLANRYTGAIFIGIGHSPAGSGCSPTGILTWSAGGAEGVSLPHGCKRRS